MRSETFPGLGTIGMPGDSRSSYATAGKADFFPLVPLLWPLYGLKLCPVFTLLFIYLFFAIPRSFLWLVLLNNNIFIINFQVWDLWTLKGDIWNIWVVIKWIPVAHWYVHQLIIILLSPQLLLPIHKQFLVNQRDTPKLGSSVEY